LLDLFPGSQISAFEVDAGLCEELNAKARSGLEYFAAVLAVLCHSPDLTMRCLNIVDDRTGGNLGRRFIGASMPAWQQRSP
jgi:hypothetical protein